MFDSSGGGGQELPSPDPRWDGFYPEVRCFYSPPRTSCRAMKSAVEPVEQLLLTLMMGMPVRPRLWYMALWPHVESPGGRHDSILENESLEAFASFSLKVVSNRTLTTSSYHRHTPRRLVQRQNMGCLHLLEPFHLQHSGRRWTHAIQSPIAVKMAACWSKHLLLSPCQGNRSCLWLRACQTAGTNRNRAFIFLSCSLRTVNTSTTLGRRLKMNREARGSTSTIH